MAKHNLDFYRLKASLCKTFADPRRLIIIEELRNGEKTVSDLMEALAIPQAAISRHLALLRERGVVQTRRAGMNIFYRLTSPKICEACDIVHDILLQQIENDHVLTSNLR
ncbi:MAG: winged helix-turn-helix transcriptional regulator [Dehalococcoidales bacterium]|nr:winged helix-turn-helix transcriptional regulator [Dehalococcoidales bacterium]